MGIKPATALVWVRRAAFGAASFVFLTLAGLWITNLADERGWFEHPSAQIEAAMSVAAAVLGSAWVHWTFGGILGFAAGVWLDAFLRRRIVATPSVEAPKTLQQRAEENRARLNLPTPRAPAMSLKEKLGDWVHTEQFTVHEAACLWAGYLPGNVVGLDAVVQSKIQAAKRLIAMDLRHTLDTSENAFSMIGNHDQSYVHRADLVALAEQKGIKPAFLYIDG